MNKHSKVSSLIIDIVLNVLNWLIVFKIIISSFFLKIIPIKCNWLTIGKIAYYTWLILENFFFNSEFEASQGYMIWPWLKKQN